MFRNMTIAALATLATAAQAQTGGLISTDRFGYSGTVQRFATMADAQAGTNAIDTINVGNRDLSLFTAQNDTSASDQNVMLGSWWYTTDQGPADQGFGAGQGRAGFGNTRGNTGVGFMQLFDQTGVTDTNVSMEFSNFNGSEYTDFTFELVGENANRADQFSRFSAIDNVNDGGIWHDYAVSLTATGLEGVEIAPGIIESINQPTGVSGSITGLFEITENDTSPANQGFYVIDLDLSMINWAYENRADLTPEISLDGGDSFFDGSFADSTFRTVPTPGAAAVLGLGGLIAARRRRS